MLLEISIYVLSSIVMLINIVLTCDTMWKCVNIKIYFLKIALIILFLFSTILFPYSFYSDYRSTLSVIAMLAFYAALFFTVQIFVKTKIGRKIYVCLFFIFVDSLFRSSFIAFLEVVNIVNNDNTRYLGSLLFNLSFLVIILLYRKRIILKSYQSSIEAISKPIYILILIVIFLMGGLVAFQTAKIDDHDLKLNISQTFSLIIIPVLLIIIVFLLINNISRKYYENISGVLEEQVKIQVNHYERIEELNDDLRGFKHDYNNHLLCLRSMLDTQSYNEAAEYIANLSDSFPVLCKNFDTGNHIADALFEEKSALCTKKSITFEYGGYIPETRIEAVDLCILLSNLLDNAIEACGKINENGERSIKITSDFKNGHLYIKVSNSVHEYVKILHNSIPTTKEDKSNHGFGLMNINRVVEKYNGIIKMKCEDNTFFTEILL